MKINDLSYNAEGSRYGYNGKKQDNEVKGDNNSLDFGARIYDPRVARWLSGDPKSSSMPGWSPFSYGFNSPNRFVDNDGELPILPILIKAGAGGAADLMAQVTINYYFNPMCQGDIEKSFGSVNWYQVGMAAAENAVPWSVPGGRVSKAASYAIGDVMMNALHSGTNYSQEDAMLDFAEGFVGNLAGAGIGDLMSKYGASAIAKGLARIGFDYKTLTGMLGGGLKHINLTLGNVTSKRMIKGWSNKVAVIGRDQKERVDVFAMELIKQGINAETFHWIEGLTDDQNFKRNEDWIQKLKDEGYTIYDTGTGPKSPNKGKDYGMETKEIFGYKE